MITRAQANLMISRLKGWSAEREGTPTRVMVPRSVLVEAWALIDDLAAELWPNQ